MKRSNKVVFFAAVAVGLFAYRHYMKKQAEKAAQISAAAQTPQVIVQPTSNAPLYQIPSGTLGVGTTTQW